MTRNGAPAGRSILGHVIQAVIALAAVTGIFLTVLRPQKVAIVEVPSQPELAARRDSLEREAERLQASIRALYQEHKELTEAIRVLSDSLATQQASHTRKDFWLITVIKTVPVLLVLAVSVALTPVLFVLDLAFLPFGAHFPILGALWSFAWDSVTVGWYWARATPLGVILGMILVLAGDGESVRRSRLTAKPRSGRYAT